MRDFMPKNERDVAVIAANRVQQILRNQHVAAGQRNRLRLDGAVNHVKCVIQLRPIRIAGEIEADLRERFVLRDGHSGIHKRASQAGKGEFPGDALFDFAQHQRMQGVFLRLNARRHADEQADHHDKSPVFHTRPLLFPISD